MAYDPADLKLPHWLLRLLDVLVAIRIPLGFGWKIGLTRPGIIFSAAITGVWAAAFYSGNNLLYLCGAMITAVSVASVSNTVRMLRRFPDPGSLLPIVQAGSVTVLRRSGALTSPAAAMVDVDLSYSTGNFSLMARCEGEELRLEGRLRPQRRGVYSCSSLTLSTDAPLGLFPVVFRRKGDGDLVVMPEPVPWYPNRGNGRTQAGQTPAGGDEWLDLRSYVPGDPLSRVHWRKASGDISSWKVKRFASETEHSHEMLLRVDLRLPAGMDASAFERMLGRVWFWVLEQRGDATLLLGQQTFELVEGLKSGALQRAIASASPETTPAIGEGGLLLAVADE
ncbi:Protein of unknown function DUF58 [Mariprofundus ferrinatatus]|uniref:Uncharacterized protein n=1 Tax=Mariprofundus ferrinatatus TaxID=1921087 RepID=A0A2K8LCJ1_9PROT|nr:DUF58 domain-containing protein [Mariprofundus ferrinatatus]ATX82624.1 Protein of unknown function DUF58 [Mariprofundus ferrinatatus]